MDREMHYFESSNSIEYWEHSHATGWRTVDKSIGDDWNGHTYRYIRWGLLDRPERVNGGPPRVRI